MSDSGILLFSSAVSCLFCLSSHSEEKKRPVLNHVFSSLYILSFLDAMMTVNANESFICLSQESNIYPCRYNVHPSLPEATSGQNWRIEIQRTIRDKFEEGKSRYIFDMYQHSRRFKLTFPGTNRHQVLLKCVACLSLQSFLLHVYHYDTANQDGDQDISYIERNIHHGPVFKDFYGLAQYGYYTFPNVISIIMFIICIFDQHVSRVFLILCEFFIVYY